MSDISDHCVCKHCTPEQAKNPDAPCPLCQLEAQLTEAKAWKESAMTVLAEWHAARETIGEDRIGWGPKEWGQNVKAQLAEARAVLREVEWEGSSGACPVCYRYEPKESRIAAGHDNLGHAPDCRLAKCIG